MRKLEMSPTEYGKVIIAMLETLVNLGRITRKDRAELAESWFAEYEAK